MATRLLVLIAALGLAATQQSSKSIETEYQEGKEYVYDYQSQILSGLPVGAKQYSGFKLTATVHFQFFSSSQVKMMLTNTRLYEINDDILKGDPTREMIPTEQFKEMTSPESARIKIQLVKPMKFKYVRGHVEDVITESGDPEWSVNMKKGCLSLLEMNFNDRNSLSREVKLQSPLRSQPNVLLYTVMEPSVMGECETTYQLHWDKRRAHMGINKVRNLDRCLEKAIHIADMTNERPCDFCDNMKTTETMSAQSSVRYSLMGSPYQYIITNAVAESQYNFVPYTETRGRMATFANQTLSLVHSEPIRVQIPEPESPFVQKLALQARHPDQKSSSPMSSWRSDLDQSPMSSGRSDLDQSELEEILKMAIEVMKKIDVMLVDKTREEMSDLILELKRLVRKMDKDILNKFIHSIITTNSWPRASKVLFDLLPMIGTYETVDVLIDLIEDIPNFSSTPAFMTLALMPQPNVFMVKRVMSYLERQENIMSDDQLLKRASWLCLGALGHKMIKTNKVQVEELERQHQIVTELHEQSNDLEVRKRLDQRLTQLVNMLRDIKEIYSDTRRQIVQRVNRLYQETKKESKRLALKVIGALGYDEFFPLIRTSINAEDTPLLWKMEGIISLQKLAKTIPVQVRRLLLPLFFDRGQPEEIRSVSFLVFVLCEPEQPELEMIAGTMRDEPSVNIASLVWTTLKELSNKTTTCSSIKSVVQNATLAMRFAEKSKEGLQYSSFTFKSAFDKNLQMGNAYEQVLLYTARQRIPVSFSMQYNAAFFGKSSDVLQFGYKGIGLDEIFNKLYGNLEETKETGILDIFSSYWKPSDGKNWEQNIKDMKEKLGVKPRHSVHPEGDIYMKVLGQELIYYDIPSIFNIPSAESSESSNQPPLGRLLPDITNIRKSIEQLLNTQRTSLYPLWSSTLTSETGLPLHVHVNMLNIFHIDGDFTLLGSSKPATQKSRLDRPQPWLNLHNSGLHELQSIMDVDMKYATSSVSLKGRLYTDVPLSLDLHYDADKTKFIVKVKNMKKMLPMKLDTTVKTIIKKFPVKVERYPIRPDIKELDFVDGVDIKLFRYVHGVDVFARNLTLEGQRAVRRDDETPLPPFSGKQVLHVIYDPMQTKEIDIQFTQMKEHTSKPERRQDRDSQDNRRDSRRFVNLDDKDAAMEYLKDKFSSDVETIPCPSKYGMLMQFSDPGLKPTHWLQLATLYQSSRNKKTQKYGMELIRSPKPSETKAWGILADMTLNFPTKVVEPSDLQTRDYQQQLQKQIRLLVTEDGKQADTLLDISTLSVTNIRQKVEELMKIGDSSSIVENLLNHILEVSSQQAAPLKDIVQEQRKLNRDTDDLLRQPVDSKQAEKSLWRLKQVQKQSKSLLEKLLTNIDSIVKDSEEPVITQYVIYLHTKMETDLVQIAQKLQPLLSSDENDVIEQILKEQTQKMKIVRKRQEHLVSSKKSIEEGSPEGIQIIKDVRDIKQMLVSLLGKMDEHLYNEQTSDLVAKVLANTKSIKEKLDKVIMDKVNIDRRVRVEFVEVILLEKQAVLDLERKIDLELQQKFTVQTSADKNVEDLTIQKVSPLKEELKRESSYLANRMVLLINNEKEIMSLKPKISPNDQKNLGNLHKIRFMQLQAMEILETKPLVTSGQQRELSSNEYVSVIVSQLKEVNQKIQDIIDDTLQGPNEEPVLCPVLIRSLDVMSVQLELIEKVQQDIREKLLSKSAQNDFNLQEYEILEEEMQHLRGKLIQKISKVEKLLKKDSSGSDRYTQKPLTLLQLQKTVIKVQSKKLELHTLMEQLLQVMSGSLSRQEPYRKQLIYSFISQGQDLQTSLTNLYQKMQNPEQSEVLLWQDIDQELWEIQQELVTMVQKVENSVQDKTRSFMTYVQDLQNLQQFKDQVQREQHKLQSQRSSTNFLPPQQKQFINDMYGVARIMFGSAEVGAKKHILIRIFGRKTLEQLLWEQDQWSPLKQDILVRQYLSDKRGQDDSVAHRYQQIKDELNTYRHLHFICTYERTVPNELREALWKIREYFKFKFYNQATLLMPDTSNTNNTVEITTEIKRNNRWMNAEIKCPQESVRFHNVRIPQFCQYYITQPTDSIQNQFIRSVTGSKPPATCLISQDRLMTLDGQIYPLSEFLQSCETVLAMDCSSENKFVVTRKSETSNPRKHLIKVVTQRHHVELIPSKPQVSVKLNGELVDLMDYPVQSSSSGEILSWVKLEDGTVEIRVPQLSLVVVYKQDQVQVKLGGLYWSRVCGICGNMDGIVSNDLEGPHQVIYPHPASFLSTYMLSGQTCNPQDIQEQHRVSEVRNQPSYANPIPMTKVLQRVDEGIKKTCFSKTPIMKCPSSSTPDGMLTESIEFSCFRSSSRVTRMLLRKQQRDKVLDEKDIPTAPGPIFTDPITQPKNCIVQ